jgi:poly-gamma-glutamate synthesis protein (capsule biosynthesis protein)
VVVSLHRGDEFVRSVSAVEKAQLRSLIDAGADLVLGHHAHVTQEIELYRGRYLVYGLGNFLSDMLWDERTRRGLLVRYGLVSHTLRVVACRTGDDYRLTKTAEYDLNGYNLTIDREVDRETAQGYRQSVAAMRVRNRNLAHWHVLKNAHRYRPKVLAQIAVNSLQSALGWR